MRTATNTQDQELNLAEWQVGAGNPNPIQEVGSGRVSNHWCKIEVNQIWSHRRKEPVGESVMLGEEILPELLCWRWLFGVDIVMIPSTCNKLVSPASASTRMTQAVGSPI
jgi:hypothetical protein